MKYIPSKVFLEQYRETEKIMAVREQAKVNKELNKINAVTESRMAVYNAVEESEKKKMKYAEFNTSVKKSLLAEAMYKLLDLSLGIHEQSTMNNAIKISLVNSFIDENGVDRVLSNFKYKSVLLSEVNRLVTKYHKQIIESVDKNNENTFVIDPETKDSFFRDLDIEDFNDVSASIKTRVSGAVDEFIQKNIEDKEEIKDIIQSTQEKVLSAKTDAVKEGYELTSKNKINKIRNSRKINIFEAMVRSLSKGVIERDDLKANYLNEGRLDMDKIVESCTIMYTFLESLQTAKIANIDEEYIHNILLDLSK